jgi:phosphoribosylglycinamide formyltransferase-1
VCAARDISCQRIDTRDREEFSRRAADALGAQHVDFVLLFFNRIVSAELYEAFATYNIHPALLPAFPGLRALKEARAMGVRFVGATLHLVTEHFDEGPIIAQVSVPVWPPATTELLDEISFVQRVYLSLLAIELEASRALVVVPREGRIEFSIERPFSPTCNPALVDPAMIQFIHRLEDERGVTVTR